LFDPDSFHARLNRTTGASANHPVSPRWRAAACGFLRGGGESVTPVRRKPPIHRAPAED